MLRRLEALAFFAAALSCFAQPPPKVELRVALFPYIPDANADKFQSLTDRIQREFAGRYPGVSLTLRPLNPVEDDFYNLDTLKTWLSNTTPQYDVVEIDAILLGELAATRLIAPWGKGIRETDWHPAARTAVTLFGDVFGVPHLLCGHFVFSTDQRITKARNINSLVQAIQRSSVGNSRFAADILGSWNTPSLYLDAWQDSHSRNPIASGLTEPLDENVVRGMATLFRLCSKKEGANPCFSGAYDDTDIPATLLAERKIAATIGYSERLHPILRTLKEPDQLHVASAPLGSGSSPLLFTDALVRRKGCSGECEKAATAFAQYLLDPASQEWLVMASDKQQPPATAVVPRYLLPATATAYDQPALQKDRLYRTLRDLTRNARSYPSFGLYSVRSVLRDTLIQRLEEAAR
jgi:thiamine pyridinylase